jgi:DNA-binding response OmpR family regulator/DNA-binding CsgD family transcriptional regulator
MTRNDAGPPQEKRRDIVLVVDDSPESLSFLTDALEEAGITVLVAVDGAGALALMEQITPDLVLMDAVMPGLDGFETCRRLKHNPHLADLPVIFMTGLSETEHIVMGLEAGGVDYVTKPIVVTQLMARIRVHLGNARRTLSARAALDATGRFLLAVDAKGEVLWSTPQAARLMDQAFPGFDNQGFALPAAARWLEERRTLSRPQANAGFTLTEDGHRFDFSYLGQTGPDEFLLRVTDSLPGGEEAFLKTHLSLTLREADVLLWIGRGKSNRDISEILGISPRTVNKHLEQIYEKLGVENRASAAALAAKALEQRA